MLAVAHLDRGGGRIVAQGVPDRARKEGGMALLEDAWLFAFDLEVRPPPGDDVEESTVALGHRKAPRGTRLDLAVEHVPEEPEAHHVGQHVAPGVGEVEAQWTLG